MDPATPAIVNPEAVEGMEIEEGPTSFQPLEVDEALAQTFGSGRYQLAVTLAVGATMYGMSTTYPNMPVFTNEKLKYIPPQKPVVDGINADNVVLGATGFFIGWTVSSLLSGLLCQTLGKKRIIFGGSIALVVCTVALISLLPLCSGGASIVVFVLEELLCGFFTVSCVIACIYTQESVPVSWRNRVMVGLNVFYSIVSSCMALGCGYVTKSLDWKWEILIWRCMGPALFLAFGAPWLGESLVHLVSTKQTTEAKSALDWIASKNKSSARTITLAVKEEDGNSTSMLATFQALASSPTLIFRALALSFCFIACGMGYFGLNYSAGNMSDNLYLNAALLNLVDIFGYFSALPADLIGRKPFQAGAFAVAAVCLTIGGFVGSPTAKIALALVGRVGLDICFNTAYVATVDCFPVAARSAALSMAQFAARLGGVFAPFCGTLPQSVSSPLFGILCAVAAVALALALGLSVSGCRGLEPHPAQRRARIRGGRRHEQLSSSGASRLTSHCRLPNSSSKIPTPSHCSCSGRGSCRGSCSCRPLSEHTCYVKQLKC